MYLNERPSETLRKLNAIRVVEYIKKFLDSIELEKPCKTKPYELMRDLEVIIVGFLKSVEDRKGINGFSILDMHDEIETIFLELDIYVDYNTYNMIRHVPYTTNYGLR